MTRAEAIERIEHIKLCYAYESDYEAFDMAIKALKPNCEAADHNPSSGKCCGYGRSENDDEPIEECKNCHQYDSYGIE